MISLPLFTRLACLGLSLIPVKERERVSGKVSNQRFVNSCLANSPSVYIYTVSIYTLSDLGDLSNLIGSLSRTIQQYSPPSEWIMCELGVFPVFFRERSFKSRQNPRADFF